MLRNLSVANLRCAPRKKCPLWGVHEYKFILYYNHSISAIALIILDNRLAIIIYDMRKSDAVHHHMMLMVAGSLRTRTTHPGRSSSTQSPAACLTASPPVTSSARSSASCFVAAPGTIPCWPARSVSVGHNIANFTLMNVFINPVHNVADQLALDPKNRDLIAKQESALQQLILLALNDNVHVVREATATLSESSYPPGVLRVSFVLDHHSI